MSLRRHTSRRATLACVTIAIGLLLAVASQARAAGPVWKLTVTPNADYFLSGSSHPGVYKIEAENVGTQATSGEVTLTNALPSSLSPEESQFYAEPENLLADVHETLCPSLAECKFPGPLEGFGIDRIKPGQRIVMIVSASVPAGVEGSLEDLAQVSGGGAPTAQASTINAAYAVPPFGKLDFAASLIDSSSDPYTQAGGHPYQFTTEFNFATFSEAESGEKLKLATKGTAPVGDPRDVTVDLPPGLLANPQGVPHCSLAEFFGVECNLNKDSVGVLEFRDAINTSPDISEIAPVLNLQPQGDTPAEFGLLANGAPLAVITAGVRSGGDYGATATGSITQLSFSRVIVTLWGVPADSSHDGLRGKMCISQTGFQSRAEFEHECELPGHALLGSGGPAGVPPTPFLTMPTECSGSQLPVVGRYNTWQASSEYAQGLVQLPAVDGCNNLRFQPRIEARPSTDLADSASGLDFRLHIPQHEGINENVTPALREAVVRLPAGLGVNPSSADGLGACSPQQIGLRTEVGQTPAHFFETPAECPDASKLGTAEVKTPLLHNPLEGSVYLATPSQNPFGTLLAAYIVLEGEGLIFKLPGRIEVDHETGQITGSFLENPQTPFEDFHLEFFGGARGALRTPAVCGTYETTSTLTPYSAPESGPPAQSRAKFETSAGPGGEGSPCPESAAAEPNAPVFRAGTESPTAGAYSPFSLRLVREDGSQELAKIDTTLPPGLTGKLAGVGECSDAQLTAAAAPGRSGREEQASPSCPLSSEVGTVQVGAGAGPTPLYVQGHAYLAGPYKGAPLSLAIITPAVAGPFDLGTVVVRTALFVDPFSAQIHAVSDEIPHILQGIPLDVRSITLKMNRPNFTLNPTDCEPLGFTGSALSVLNVAAPLTQRFQVGGCSTLPFKPKLALSLKGGTRRHTFPALTATLTMAPGSANIASAQVTLPHAEQVEQAHITSQVCTRPQLASHTCPKTSIYGYAEAVTPLLDHPLEGPVYLGVGFGHLLPDLVAELGGQITVLLHGKVDTGREGALRNTFEVVPDAPVSKFTLSLFGGKKSLIVNSENICGPRAKVKALAKFRAQNGKAVELEPTVENSCKGKGKKKGKGPKHRVSRLVGTSHR